MYEAYAKTNCIFGHPIKSTFFQLYICTRSAWPQGILHIDMIAFSRATVFPILHSKYCIGALFCNATKILQPNQQFPLHDYSRYSIIHPEVAKTWSIWSNSPFRLSDLKPCGLAPLCVVWTHVSTTAQVVTLFALDPS